MTEQERRKLVHKTAEAFGISLVDAGFMVAIHLGEVDGDVIRDNDNDDEGDDDDEAV